MGSGNTANRRCRARRLVLSAALFLPSSVFSLSFGQDSAEQNYPAGAPAVPVAPLQAQPVVPLPPVAVPVPEGPKAIDPRPFSPPPPAMTAPSKIQTAPGASQAPGTPAGVTVSEVKADARMIEVFRPERVKVYPDDPDSAWWEINPHYAFDRAQREQKPLMLLFTGIWNDQAMALSQEVFSTKSFNDYVKENLVICYLNYERNITDTPDVLRRLKDKFKVKGYPNVLLFNPNGEVEKGIRGYRRGRPVDYFNQLRGACLPILEAIEVQKQAYIRRGYRDWSNYIGKVIFAKFLRHDGTLVELGDLSGQRWTIKINDLAPPDQKLVESFPSVATLQKPPEAGE